MINLAELRLGNYVYGADPTCIMRATLEHFYSWSETPGLACPIVLTPEVLLDCGFRLGDKWFIHQIYYMDYRFELCQNRHEIVYGYPIYGKEKVQGFNKLSPNITSLHQLQNLFFAITGTELEYKYKHE